MLVGGLVGMLGLGGDEGLGGLPDGGGGLEELGDGGDGPGLMAQLVDAELVLPR